MNECFLVFEEEGHRGEMAPTLGAADNVYFARRRPEILIAEVDDDEAARLESEGVRVIPATRYEPLADQPLDAVFSPLTAHPLNLSHVLAHIRAPQAWTESQGEGIHVAVVDTGVCGSLKEFPAWKRSPYEWSHHGSAWTDLVGHGSMCAAVAAATSSAGGHYDGVAPRSKVIACKTTFDDTQLYQIYEYLLDLVEEEKVGRLVISNSYGSYRCSPPAVDPADPFPSIVRRAVDAGIVVAFAAGNNHVKVCGNDPLRCDPNTIWGPNSLDEVITVGTVDASNRMDQPPSTAGGYSHRDSSRGPGQLATATVKPNCVAPTYGEVVWGCGYVPMQWWGTSGACPQVAGLAALMLAKNPSLTPATLGATIEGTCTSLPLARTCVGAGLINCQQAVAAV